MKSHIRLENIIVRESCCRRRFSVFALWNSVDLCGVRVLNEFTVFLRICQFLLAEGVCFLWIQFCCGLYIVLADLFFVGCSRLLMDVAVVWRTLHGKQRNNTESGNEVDLNLINKQN